jgi:hypothetical protein
MEKRRKSAIARKRWRKLSTLVFPQTFLLILALFWWRRPETEFVTRCPLLEPSPDTKAKDIFDDNRYKECELGIKERHCDYDVLRPDTISDKRCAIVGSSGALLRSSYGSEIDQHDVVVRFGIPRLNATTSGTKTTLLFLNPSVLTTKDNVQNMNTWFEALAIRPDVLSVNCRTLRCRKQLLTIFQRNQNETVLAFTDCIFIRDSFHILQRISGLRWPRASRPTSGMYSLPYFLQNCAQVNLYGYWPFHTDCAGNYVSHHFWSKNSEEYHKVHLAQLDFAVLFALRQKFPQMQIHLGSDFQCASFLAEELSNGIQQFHEKVGDGDIVSVRKKIA